MGEERAGKRREREDTVERGRVEMGGYKRMDRVGSKVVGRVMKRKLLERIVGEIGKCGGGRKWER